MFDKCMYKRKVRRKIKQEWIMHLRDAKFWASPSWRLLLKLREVWWCGNKNGGVADISHQLAAAVASIRYKTMSHYKNKIKKSLLLSAFNDVLPSKGLFFPSHSLQSHPTIDDGHVFICQINIMPYLCILKSTLLTDLCI